MQLTGNALALSFLLVAAIYQLVDAVQAAGRIPRAVDTRTGRKLAQYTQERRDRKGIAANECKQFAAPLSGGARLCQIGSIDRTRP